VSRRQLVALALVLQFLLAAPAAAAFTDEFTGPAGAPPNPSVWAAKTELRSGELECYTARPVNVSLNGAGQLAITARRETNTLCGKQRDYTSGRIDTRGKRTWQYGTVEARIKLPDALGAWPAFWAVGYPGTWPAAGEIDMLEYPESSPSRQLKAHQGLHADTSSGAHCSYGGHDQTALVPWWLDWHVYAIDWRKDVIEWFIDGVRVWRVTPGYKPGCHWQFNRPFGLLLNVAVGGWGGTPISSQFPAVMLVDWVRVTP
jgi:beta-glucanase (GH16 family)